MAYRSQQPACCNEWRTHIEVNLKVQTRVTYSEFGANKNRATKPVFAVRQFVPSNLGWFYETRRAIGESGKERAVNINSQVMMAWYPNGIPRKRRIDINTRYFSGNATNNGQKIVVDERVIANQGAGKNWRLAGEAIKGQFYGTIRAGDFILMLFDPEQALLSWMCIRGTLGSKAEHNAHSNILKALGSPNAGAHMWLPSLSQRRYIIEQAISIDPNASLLFEVSDSDESKSDTDDEEHNQSLRPRARILRTLGDELISNERVAIIELVKNSYDADATRVLVRLVGPLQIGAGRIEVIDNGSGMSEVTVREHWFEPATKNKRRARLTKEFKRRVLGEKGIGRFAVSKLADELHLVTRDVGSDKEITLDLEWQQFDQEKYLDEIQISWRTRKPVEIKPGGYIDQLWTFDPDMPESDERQHGTILRMQYLRLDWHEETIRSLRSDLSRLIAPAGKLSQDNFLIALDLPSEFKYLAGIIGPPEALKNPNYLLKGSVASDGTFELTLDYKDGNRRERFRGSAKLSGNRSPRCGPFAIELRVWDRDTPALEKLARGIGSTVKDVRRDLDRATGISIYRDSFRVLPYGEENMDWLRLNYRRVNNPGLRLSTNQIAGYVYITSEGNPQLRDQSNREGLINGPALEDFRELVTTVIAELETRRYTARHQPQSQLSLSKGGMFADLNLHDVTVAIRNRYPNDLALLELVQQKDRVLGRKIDEVQHVLARYRRLATFGQLVDAVIHDGRAPLTKIGNETLLGKRDVQQQKHAGKTGEIFRRIGKRLESIDRQAEALNIMFERLEPFGGRRTSILQEGILESMISQAFDVLKNSLKEAAVKVQVSQTETKVLADPIEISEIIVNLIANSLYWLRHMSRDQRRIIVQVQRLTLGDIEVLFSDNGPGVSSEARPFIFDPYFSTKPNGVGLGLTIAGEIIKEHYSGDFDLVDRGPLPGANFRIILRNQK